MEEWGRDDRSFGRFYLKKTTSGGFYSATISQLTSVWRRVERWNLIWFQFGLSSKNSNHSENQFTRFYTASAINNFPERASFRFGVIQLILTIFHLHVYPPVKLIWTVRAKRRKVRVWCLMNGSLLGSSIRAHLAIYFYILKVLEEDEEFVQIFPNSNLEEVNISSPGRQLTKAAFNFRRK